MWLCLAVLAWSALRSAGASASARPGRGCSALIPCPAHPPAPLAAQARLLPQPGQGEREPGALRVHAVRCGGGPCVHRAGCVHGACGSAWLLLRAARLLPATPPARPPDPALRLPAMQPACAARARLLQQRASPILMLTAPPLCLPAPVLPHAACTCGASTSLRTASTSCACGRRMRCAPSSSEREGPAVCQGHQGEAGAGRCGCRGWGRRPAAWFACAGFGSTVAARLLDWLHPSTRPPAPTCSLPQRGVHRGGGRGRRRRHARVVPGARAVA